MQPHASEVASVSFRDTRNRTLATMTIIARSAETLFLLPEKEASDRNEEPAQIVEGFSYEYEVDGLVDDWRIRSSAVVQPSKRHPTLGRVEPGLAVGLLPLVIENSHGDPVARATVEVRTSKLDYHRDYRLMLDELADMVLGLLTDIRAPSMARLRLANNAATEVTHHQFAFLRATLDSRQFRDAVARVLGRPHRRWVVQQESDRKSVV